jgi:hypothetical protein
MGDLGFSLPLHDAVDSVSKSQYTAVIDKFLTGADYEIFRSPNAELEDYLLDQFLEQGIGKTKATRIARQGALVAQQFYPLQTPELHRLTGLYAGYFFVLDDICVNESEMRHFRRNFVEKLPQGKPFEGCANLLRHLDADYLEFCSDKITSGLINHMSSTALEYETTGKFCHLRSSPRFPEYFRSMTGNPEGFVYLIVPRGICAGYDERMNLFVQAVPELIDFTNKVNDILSFYKESIVSTERNGYVYHRAEANQVPVLECLNGMVDEVHGNIRHIQTMLKGDPDLSEAVNAYIRGYIGFHVIEPRYKISELGVSCLTGKSV